MPCVDISDDIVQTGREILEKVRKMIHFLFKYIFLY